MAWSPFLRKGYWSYNEKRRERRHAGIPVVVGEAVVTQPLSVSWREREGEKTWQWWRGLPFIVDDGAAIAVGEDVLVSEFELLDGETADSYTPTSDDIGYIVGCRGTCGPIVRDSEPTDVVYAEDLLGGLGWAHPGFVLGTNLSVAGSVLTATTGVGSNRQANLPLALTAGVYRISGTWTGTGSFTPRLLGAPGGTINGTSLGAGSGAWSQDLTTPGSTSLNFLVGNTSEGVYDALQLQRVG